MPLCHISHHESLKLTGFNHGLPAGMARPTAPSDRWQVSIRLPVPSSSRFGAYRYALSLRSGPGVEAPPTVSLRIPRLPEAYEAAPGSRSQLYGQTRCLSISITAHGWSAHGHPPALSCLGWPVGFLLSSRASIVTLAVSSPRDPVGLDTDVQDQPANAGARSPSHHSFMPVLVHPAHPPQG